MGEEFEATGQAGLGAGTLGANGTERKIWREIFQTYDLHEFPKAKLRGSASFLSKRKVTTYDTYI